MQDRRFRIFLVGVPLFLAAVIVISGLLSPPVFSWVDSLAPDRWPFKRVFNRVLMIAAVFCLVPWVMLIKGLSFKDLYIKAKWVLIKIADFFKREGLGQRINNGVRLFLSGPGLKMFFYGWVIGLAHVALLGGVHLLFGARDWNWELTLGRFIGYIASGLAVGVIEELIFRGGLCLTLRKCSRGILITVVLVGSTFFALVHFPHAEHLPGSITAMSGWEMWTDLGRQFLNPADVIERWFGLWLAGICLCVAALRSGKLWLPIGIHAGWVCGIKSNNRISDATAESASVLWGGHPLDGMVAWIFIIGLLIWLWRGALPHVERSD